MIHKPVDAFRTALMTRNVATSDGNLTGGQAFFTEYDASNAYKTFVPQLQRIAVVNPHAIFLPRGGFENGLVSRVTINNSPQDWYVPMVDFKTPVLKDIIDFHKEFLSEYTLHIFDTGNSFHGYGACLLDKEGWDKFLGKLLLGKPGTVDYRWVGHSLINGFGILRVSSRTKPAPLFKHTCQAKLALPAF